MWITFFFHWPLRTSGQYWLWWKWDNEKESNRNSKNYATVYFQLCHMSTLLNTKKSISTQWSQSHFETTIMIHMQLYMLFFKYFKKLSKYQLWIRWCKKVMWLCKGFDLIVDRSIWLVRNCAIKNDKIKKWRITNYELRITNYKLRITNYELRIMNH